MYICSLCYPACNAHAPYCHLYSTPLYSIFPHFLINDTILWKKFLNTKCVFWFSLQLLSETFLNPRIIQRDMIQNVHISLFMKSTRHSCQTFKKTQFLSTEFWKCPNVKLHENPSIGGRVVSRGPTDRQTWLSRFSQFYETHLKYDIFFLSSNRSLVSKFPCWCTLSVAACL